MGGDHKKVLTTYIHKNEEREGQHPDQQSQQGVPGDTVNTNRGGGGTDEERPRGRGEGGCINLRGWVGGKRRGVT